MKRKIIKAIRQPRRLLLPVLKLMSKLIADVPYLKTRYRLLTGRKLNLTDPQTFNEKLQWLKLHDRQPIYTQMADKLGMRDYVTERLNPGTSAGLPVMRRNDAPDYLVPLLGV